MPARIRAGHDSRKAPRIVRGLAFQLALLVGLGIAQLLRTANRHSLSHVRSSTYRELRCWQPAVAALTCDVVTLHECRDTCTAGQ